MATNTYRCFAFFGIEIGKLGYNIDEKEKLFST
jgi:hypothetical protein